MSIFQSKYLFLKFLSFLNSLKNCVKAVPGDLLSFSYFEKILIIILLVISIIFSIFNFNALIDKKYDFVKSENDLIFLSGISSFTGILFIVLTTRLKISMFFWSFINCIFFSIFVFHYGYIGDFQIYVFYLIPMQLYSCHCWALDTKEIETYRLSFYEILYVFISLIVLIFFFYHEIPEVSILFTGSYEFANNTVAHTLDSVTSSINIVGQMLVLYKYTDSWFLWIIADSIQIAKYSGISGFGLDINIVVMYSIYTLNSFYGLYYWSLKGPKKNVIEENIIEGQESQEIV